MEKKISSEAPHGDGCCADVFEKNSTAGRAGDVQKVFREFMRSVQAPGALTGKNKELILFALVLQSRCAACFDAHYERALELGITREELDEAAWCAIAMGGAPVRMFYQECLRRVERLDQRH